MGNREDRNHIREHMKIIMGAFKYLRSYPLLSVYALCAMIAASCFEGMSFGMLIPLIQSMVGGRPSFIHNIPFLEKLFSVDQTSLQPMFFIIILMGLFLIICFKNIFLYVSTMLISRLRLVIVRDLSTSLMDRLIGYDIAYFDKAKTGHLLTNIDAETNRIGIFVLSVLNLFFLVIRIMSYIIVLILISWKVSAILFLLVALVLIPLEIIMKRLAALSGALSKALNNFNFKMLEILNGIRLIRERGAEASEGVAFKLIAEQVFQCHYRVNRYTSMLVPISETVIMGLIVVSLSLLILICKIDIAVLFPFIAAYMVVLTKALSQLNLLNTTRSVAASNVAAITNYEHMSDDNGKRIIVSGSVKFCSLSKSIVFQDIGFSYEVGKDVFSSLCLLILSGKMTAVVGSSGAGKTTLVNLIMRFYDPVAGSIMVDGTDLRQMDLCSWRRKIGFVSQNIFLFNTSVRNNIAYGIPSVTDEQVVKAARIARAEEFIMKLPHGYDTVIGERGAQLSGGQRQRLSIARAVIEDPDILILDEATSSLDSETESMISEALELLMKNKTVIAIAHRLSTVKRADKIVVLNKGAVAAEGSHDELMRSSELYRKLYETQFSE